MTKSLRKNFHVEKLCEDFKSEGQRVRMQKGVGDEMGTKGEHKWQKH